MSEIRKITCINCAVGCPIEVEYDGEEVLSVRNVGEPICDAGKRGLEYARKEFKTPERVLTTTLRVQNGTLPLVPVITNIAVPKSLLFDCMQALAPVEVKAPIHLGDVLFKDLLGTGADVVASGSVSAKE